MKLSDRPPTSLVQDPLRAAVQDGALRFTYRGIATWKDPFDLALYSMMLWRERPRTIIEIGSNVGGSAIWLRDTMAVMGLLGRVVSVDLNPPAVSGEHLLFLRGDGRQLQSCLDDAFMAALERPLLVIEDADHQPETTLAVLQFFDRWLVPREMIVIEDGNATELYPGRHGRGPLGGIDDFLNERGGDYLIDAGYCDFFGQNVTWNTNGYLRRTG